MIELRNLHVRYAQDAALSAINLSIPCGSFLLVGGRSGSGKSTLAHTIVGLIPHTMPGQIEGHISVVGLDPRQHSVSRIATHVGLVFQNPAVQLFNGTTEAEVAFGPRNLGLGTQDVADRVTFALDAVAGSHLRHREVRHLSSGEQQRVAIAAVLAMRPRTVILDEPCANLDAAGVDQLTQTLARLHRQSGITLILIEHRLSPFLPYADRLVWLAQGRVVADGDPTETWARMAPPSPAPPRLPPATNDPLVTLREVTAGYEGAPVVRDCSLTLHQGDFAALVGPNGAGKTTLARVLTGLLRPQHGRVAWHTNRHRPRVGLLQQNPLHQLVCDTVEEEIYFGPHNLGLEHPEDVEAAFEHADLDRLRYRLTGALSAGEQQRTALVATMALNPALLILDEPTVGQDWSHLTQAMDLVSRLNRAGQTVLLITHDHRLIERYPSRVWRLQDGSIHEARLPSG